MPSPRISYHRTILDNLLHEHQSRMRGIVVDVGGEQKSQRGDFRYSQNSDGSFFYSVNINSDAAPHVYGDAHFLPIASNTIDCVLCCEVLEHVKDPRKCCDEIWRVLKPGGIALISTPFLFPIHADPEDYQRFTPSGLKVLLRNFTSIRITSMGGSLGTLGELIVLAGNSLENYRSIRKIVKLIGTIMIWAEKRIGAFKFQGTFSTGYFAEAHKP
jgi:SAM-dependent methyltransferase